MADKYDGMLTTPENKYNSLGYGLDLNNMQYGDQATSVKAPVNEYVGLNSNNKLALFTQKTLEKAEPGSIHSAYINGKTYNSILPNKGKVDMAGLYGTRKDASYFGDGTYYDPGSNTLKNKELWGKDATLTMRDMTFEQAKGLDPKLTPEEFKNAGGGKDITTGMDTAQLGLAAVGTVGNLVGTMAGIRHDKSLLDLKNKDYELSKTKYTDLANHHTAITNAYR